MPQLIGTAPNQVPTNGDLGSAAYMDTSAFYGAGLNPAFRNKLHNGAFLINQRGTTSATIVPGTDDNSLKFDRWRYRNSTQGDGRFSVELSTDVPTGEFFQSHKATVTTVNTATSIDRVYAFGQTVEGFNFIDAAWGTAQAKPVTVSFWIKSSIPGTYSLGFMNQDAGRGYAADYTITAANTWEYKSVTVPGCIDGTWLKGTGIGLQLWWLIGTSPSRTGFPGSWLAANMHGSVNNTNWIGTNGATLFITGAQLEIGTRATAFEHRPYSTELALCQRYFQIASIYAEYASGTSGTLGTPITTFPVPMRVSPTITNISTAGSGNTVATYSVFNRNGLFYGYAINMTVSGTGYLYRTSTDSLSAEL